MKNNLGDTGTGAQAAIHQTARRTANRPKQGTRNDAAKQFKRTGGHFSTANRQAIASLRDTDGRQQSPLNRIEHRVLTPNENSRDAFDNYGDVIPRRYTLPDCLPAYFTKQLILLHFIKLVPVVGLEPTRLFKVPGF